jgi:transposase
MEYLLIDSTIIRAHPCAAGAPKSGDQEAQALGRSHGGFSTKVYIAVDALGNPLRFRLMAGQHHDSSQAARLIEDFEPKALIDDKGYDSDELIKAVIPPKKNRLVQRQYDRHLYCERHLIERFINKVKYDRRVFSRFEKLSKNYMAS